MDKAAESVCCKSFKSPVITNEGKFIIVLREGVKQNLLFRWKYFIGLFHVSGHLEQFGGVSFLGGKINYLGRIGSGDLIFNSCVYPHNTP